MHTRPGQTWCSIIIPVLNEALVINSVLEHVLGLEGIEDCEIIVVDGDLECGTINSIDGHDVFKITSEPGRASQMNAGANAANGEILLFLHADTRLPDDGLLDIARTMRDERYVCGAFSLEIDSDNFFLKILSGMTTLRSRFTRIPYGDQAIFIRRRYFEKIGQYSAIPFLEDLELMREIKKRKGKVCILPERVKTSPRRWEREGYLYTTMRNIFVVALHSLGVSAEKLSGFYPKH